MKNSMNLATSMGLTLQDVFLDILGNKKHHKRQKEGRIVQSNEDPKKQKRPKVTKIVGSPRSAESIPESYSNERPKVTKVVGKRRKSSGQDDLYDYTFDFTIEMNGNSGNVTIFLSYESYEPVEFTFKDVEPSKTLLVSLKADQELLFGGLSNNTTYDVEITCLMGLNSPDNPIVAKPAKMRFNVVPPVQFTFLQKVRNFFRRLFKN